jgi:hypothetical protein
MGNQRLHAIELLFLADEGVECDLDLAVVKVVVEAEQMRL